MTPTDISERSLERFLCIAPTGYSCFTASAQLREVPSSWE